MRAPPHLGHTNFRFLWAEWDISLILTLHFLQNMPPPLIKLKKIQHDLQNKKALKNSGLLMIHFPTPIKSIRSIPLRHLLPFGSWKRQVRPAARPAREVLSPREA